MKLLFVLLASALSFKLLLFIVPVCALFFIVFKIRKDNKETVQTSVPAQTNERENFIQNNIETAFKELDGILSNFERVNPSNFDFLELGEFEEKVIVIKNRLVFMGTSRNSVITQQSDLVRLDELVERIGKVIDKINQRKAILQKTPYNPNADFVTNIA